MDASSESLYFDWRKHRREESFVALYERHDDDLRQWLRGKFKRLNKCSSTLDDVCSECWLVVIDPHCAAMKAGRNFQSWHRTVARNRMLKALKGFRRTKLREPEFWGALTDAIHLMPLQSLRLYLVLAVIEAFDENEKIVFRRAFQDGWTDEQVAVALGVKRWKASAIKGQVRGQLEAALGFRFRLPRNSLPTQAPSVRVQPAA